MHLVCNDEPDKKQGFDKSDGLKVVSVIHLLYMLLQCTVLRYTFHNTIDILLSLWAVKVELKRRRCFIT